MGLISDVVRYRGALSHVCAEIRQNTTVTVCTIVQRACQTFLFDPQIQLGSAAHHQ